MESHWRIIPTGEGISINNKGIAKLPKNTGDTDITYTITYEESGYSNSCNYVVKPCGSEPSCDGIWAYEFGSIAPVIQGYDTGGTPIDVVVKHNGNPVSNLTESDLIVHLGDNGEYDNILTGLQILAKPENGRYIIGIIKTDDVSQLCPLIGKTINCTLATQNCPSQTGGFKIKIEQYQSWNLIVQGCKYDQNSIYIGFYYKVSPCGTELKVGEVQAVRAIPDDGYLHHKINIHKGAILDSSVRFVLANAGGNYCQAPTCAKIISAIWPNLYVLYCPDGPCH